MKRIRFHENLHKVEFQADGSWYSAQHPAVAPSTNAESAHFENESEAQSFHDSFTV